MLETIMENQVIFYAMGVAAAIGVIGKLISHITLRRMVQAAGEMNKSNHKLMRLVRAKFEHANMLSDKVQNVEVFVKKYVYEYKVFGIHLHAWQSLVKKSIWLIGILGLAGVGISGYLYGVENQVFQYAVWTGAGVAALFFIYMSSDENYSLQIAENYMIDFLENVCAHRYTKVHKENVIQMEERFQHEEEPEEIIQEAAVREEAVQEEVPQQTVMEMEKDSREIRIREILEEFLA